MDIQSLLSEIENIEHGFKHIIAAGNKLLGSSDLDHRDIATGLLKDERYQFRMLGVYLLGEISIDDRKALDILTTEVVEDVNWRVQEMLAKALDRYCAQKGYEESLPDLKKWLAGKNSNLKRAVIEGLRIWTSRPYFKQHPQAAIGLICQHKADESEYLRKSVGNALRDISKKHSDLVNSEIESWNLADTRIRLTYKHVLKA